MRREDEIARKRYVRLSCMTSSFLVFTSFLFFRFSLDVRAPLAVDFGWSLYTLDEVAVVAVVVVVAAVVDSLNFDGGESDAVCATFVSLVAPAFASRCALAAIVVHGPTLLVVVVACWRHGRDLLDGSASPPLEEEVRGVVLILQSRSRRESTPGAPRLVWFLDLSTAPAV